MTFFRNVGIVIGPFAIASVGCVPMTSNPNPTAKVRVVHASPDAPDVDVCVAGAIAFADASFPSATDYATLEAGTYNINVTGADAGCASTGVIEADLTFAADTETTIAAVNVLDNIEPLVLSDDNTAPAAGNTRIRFVHAAPDAPTVDITLVDGTTLFDNVGFKQVGAYLEIAAGTVDIQVRDETGMTVVLELPNVTLEGGGVYTVFAVGLFTGEPALGALITVDNAM